MGFDYRLFAQFERGLRLKKYPIMPYDIRVIRCLSNVPEWCDILNKDGSMLQFKPASGWEGEDRNCREPERNDKQFVMLATIET